MTLKYNSRPFFIFLLFLASFLVYWNTISFEFVYDDNVQVVNNEWIKGIEHIPEIFTSTVWEHIEGQPLTNTYRPVMHMVYMAGYHLFGLSPWGYHLVNIILHAINSALVFIVASVLFGKGAHGESEDKYGLVAPFLVALLFALHPINTEVVSWVAAVPELTVTIFFLSSFYLYVRATSSEKVRTSKLVLSIFIFFLAMLSKETGVALLLVILAYDFCIKRTLLNRWFLYIPYLAAFTLYMVIRTLVLGGFINVENVTLSTYETIINVFPLGARYAGHLLLPVGLKAIYPLKPVSSVLEPMTLIGLAVFFAIGILFFLARRNRLIFFALLWIIIPLLPVMYIPAVSVGGFADRYLYLSSIGFSMLIVYYVRALILDRDAVFKGIGARRARAVFYAIFAVVIILYAAGSMNRSRVWKDDLALWTDTARGFPDKVQQTEKVHYNLAWALHKRGDLDRAINEYKKTLSENPKKEKAHFNLAIIYEKKGNMRGAMEHYTQTVKLNPLHEMALYNLATLHAGAGDPKEAIALYTRLLSLNPLNENAHYNLAVTYGLMNEHKMAIMHYKEVLKIAPGSADVYYNMGLMYKKLRLFDMARKAFLSALEIDPGLNAARIELDGIMPGGGT